MPQPQTVTQFLKTLSPDRRTTIAGIRKAIRANLDPKLAESVENGATNFFMPHSAYPAGDPGNLSEPFPGAGIAAHKHHIGLYVFCVYTDCSVDRVLLCRTRRVRRAVFLRVRCT